MALYRQTFSRCYTVFGARGIRYGRPSQSQDTGPPSDDFRQRKLFDSIIHLVSDFIRDFLNAPVTAATLSSAIRHMKASSAPGLKGLTAGFYQVAPAMFGECLSIVSYDLICCFLRSSNRRLLFFTRRVREQTWQLPTHYPRTSRCQDPV